MGKDDPIAVSLSAQERELLRSGLEEWEGPAHPTDDLAVAMGFTGVEDLLNRMQGLRTGLVESSPMTPMDWARALIATEVAFASDVYGSGWDWSSTTGLTDEETIRLLRQVQRKLIGVVAPVLRNPRR